MLKASHRPHRDDPSSSPGIETGTSDTVTLIIGNSNSIENPQMTDFEALEPGDILISSTKGSQRVVLVNNPETKRLALRVIKDTTQSNMSLPPLYDVEGGTIPMTKGELFNLPPNAKVFMKRDKGEEHIEVILHSVEVGKNSDTSLRGVYSHDEVRSYEDAESIRAIATKIIKKPKEA